MASSGEIPLVDFRDFASFDEEKMDEKHPEINKLSQEILDAFTTVGFVYIKNHGLPQNEVKYICVCESPALEGKGLGFIVFCR